VAVKLYWTPRACEDLLEIYCRIGADNPAAAERIFTAIEAKIEMLAKYLRAGPRRQEIRASTRILVEEPYLVLYETVPTRMRVLSRL
jgi:toxin ParE1/3/4